MFFTQGNAETTANQCGFYFDGPNGVFVEGGTNPWSDAIKKFPFKYEGVPVCGDYCEPAIVGCTLSFACDYNPEANVDGDCTFPIEYYEDATTNASTIQMGTVYVTNSKSSDVKTNSLQLQRERLPIQMNARRLCLDALTQRCSTTTSRRTRRTTAASTSMAAWTRQSTMTKMPTLS